VTAEFKSYSLSRVARCISTPFPCALVQARLQNTKQPTALWAARTVPLYQGISFPVDTSPARVMGEKFRPLQTTRVLAGIIYRKHCRSFQVRRCRRPVPHFSRSREKWDP
jgi:hypothetical protein